MFESALKNKYRFETTKGLITTEDLFDLPLSSRNGFDLDSVAITLAQKIQETPEVSFVKTTNTSSKLLKDKLDVVKYVIAQKLSEAEAKEQAMVNQSKKEFLKEIIKEKQIDELKGKSLEELQAELSKI